MNAQDRSSSSLRGSVNRAWGKWRLPSRTGIVPVALLAGDRQDACPTFAMTCWLVRIAKRLNPSSHFRPQISLDPTKLFFYIRPVPQLMPVNAGVRNEGMGMIEARQDQGYLRKNSRSPPGEPAKSLRKANMGFVCAKAFCGPLPIL